MNLDPKKHHHEWAKKKKRRQNLKRAKGKKKQEAEEENQKNFNSFIHSINIILDMVFLCTLYIFKGTHSRRMDCGVKKVCEGFKHRMVRAWSTVQCFGMDRVYAPTNGNRKKKKKKRNGEKNSKWKINSSTVRVLLKANREKKLYIQTYRCVYISFSAWALNDVIAGIRRVNPKIFSSSSFPPVLEEE